MTSFLEVFFIIIASNTANKKTSIDEKVFSREEMSIIKEDCILKLNNILYLNNLYKLEEINLKMGYETNLLPKKPLELTQKHRNFF